LKKDNNLILFLRNAKLTEKDIVIIVRKVLKVSSKRLTFHLTYPGVKMKVGMLGKSFS
jgi:hypothetical protein